jgi:pilus assembly protein FimV
MVRKLALAVSIALGTVSVPAHALGLGELDSSSGLNQAFEGRIPLLSVRPDEMDGVRIRLADAAAFERAGVDRPYFLTLLNFAPATDASGKPIVRVTSNFPIREPFLNFLVEVNWPNGRLVREYTVLLDPPTLAAPTPVRTEPATRAATRAAPTRQPVATRPAAPPSPPALTGDSYRVRANDTAWAIAQRIRPAGATMEQTMIALLETNPDGFINRNINLLKRGQILRLPSSDEILGLARQQARAEFRNQQDAWRSQQDRQPDAPAATTEAEPADDQLRIATVEPETEIRPGPDTVPEAEQPAAPVAEELQQMLISARENAETSRQEAEDLRVRMDDLQARLEDMKRLLNLKDDQLAQLQQRLTDQDAPPAVSEAPAEPPDVPEPVVAETMPEPDPVMPEPPLEVDQPVVTEEPRVAPSEIAEVPLTEPSLPLPAPAEIAETTPTVELPSISDYEMAPQVDADAVVREAIEGPAEPLTTDAGPAGSESALASGSPPRRWSPTQSRCRPPCRLLPMRPRLRVMRAGRAGTPIRPPPKRLLQVHPPPERHRWPR